MNRNNYYKFRSRNGEMTLELGDIVQVGQRYYRFIKTTSKGFNFVALDTHKVWRSKGHFYDSNWSNCDIPYGETEFTVMVPYFFRKCTQAELNKLLAG